MRAFTPLPGNKTTASPAARQRLSLLADKQARLIGDSIWSNGRGASRIARCAAIAALAMVTACGEPEDLTGSNGGAAIAYIQRPVSSDPAIAAAQFGAPTDIKIFVAGSDLYIREEASPKSNEYNLTRNVTRGDGDVADPDISSDGTRLVFAMRCGPGSQPICSGNDTWNIWQYDMSKGGLTNGVLTQLTTSSEFNDVDPAYLPNGDIVFSSDRQERSREILANLGVEPYSYLDEDLRAPARVLHRLSVADRGIRQISFNQSHDLNPTVLTSGEILFSRWDNVGSRSRVSLYRANPDGTKMNVAYGAHTDDSEAFMYAREMDNGQILATVMPLDGTFMGGRLVTIDIHNHTDNSQWQPTFQDVPLLPGFAPQGRFSTPYPIWDGSGRALVAYTPPRPTQQVNPISGETQTVNGTPGYGVNLLSLLDQTLVSLALPGLNANVEPATAILDPVPLSSRPRPPLPPKSVDGDLEAATNQLAGNTGIGVINIKSVYESDGVHGFGDEGFLTKNVDLPSEFPITSTLPPTIPRMPGTQAPDIDRFKSAAFSDPTDPARATLYGERPARLLRITRAVSVPPGLHPSVIGNTEHGMQEILGYAEIQPDGSAKVEVPADVPLTLAVVDAEGRAFQMHTGWVQARPGETLQCAGCHSSHMQDRKPVNRGPIDFDKTKEEIRALIAGETDPAVRAQLEQRYPEPLIDGHPNPVNPLDPNNTAGLTMAEVRYANPDVDFSRKLRQDIAYRDFWTAAYNNAGRPGGVADAGIDLPYGVLPMGMASPVILNQNGSFSRIVIDYPRHIQPLWDNYCIGCHNQTHPTLDLRAGDTVPAGWSASYDELLRGNSPRVNVADAAGGARASSLLEVLFHQELRSPRSLPSRDHSTTLPPGLRRLVVEWIDSGAQYYNDPFTDNANADGIKDYRTELRRYR